MKPYLIVLLAWMTGLSEQTPARQSAVVAIRAGRVLNVRTGQYLSNQVIRIEGGRIAAVGPAAEITPKLPPGATPSICRIGRFCRVSSMPTRI